MIAWWWLVIAFLAGQVSLLLGLCLFVGSDG